MLFDNVLGLIGKTPLVRFNHLASGLACDMYGKCEFQNPGGSVKDRVALATIEAAEKAGLIKSGDTLIEATSGNTGIGIAMIGAVKKYNVIITLPEKMSREKEVIMEALGAKIYRTPTAVAWDHPDSHISLAKKLAKELPNAFFLNQYNNTANPEVHYQTTAQEILTDAGDGLAMIVLSVGTGGTITGVAKKIKELNKDIKIIGVDPYGSILGGGTDICPYLVEGIGYDFIPSILDNNLIDEYIKVNDKDSFQTARRIIRTEGLLVGGSSGAAVWGALKAAKHLKKWQKCVVILPDGIRNYLTKFADNRWMQAQGFLDE